MTASRRQAPLLRRLRKVRSGGALLPVPPPEERPATTRAAYAIAAALTRGLPVAGWKVGATSARARALLRLEEPFYGRILESSLHRSPATLRLNERTLTIDAEIGLELGADLPARRHAYARGDVAAAIRRVLPLLEINSPSFAEPFAAGGLCLLADNGVNAGAVLGAPGSVRLDEIPTTRVVVSLDGRATGSGTVPAPPDDPLSSLLWLANTLAAQGLGLQSGQVIATGALAPPLEVNRECQIEADFGALGAVQATFIGGGAGVMPVAAK